MDSSAITRTIEEVLRHLRVTVESIEVSDVDGRQCFSIRTPDSHALIGTKGANLSALNHLIKKIVSAKNASGKSAAEDEHEKTFFVDVNGYQEMALTNVKTVAKIMGDRARSFKTNVELEPMSSYERMVIHAFFQEAKDLKTESIGEGDKRRVVIKYVEEGALGS